MDVTLPDGSVLKGVPDGTTKAQLTEKLKANGYDVSKLGVAPTGAEAIPTDHAAVPPPKDVAATVAKPSSIMDAPEANDTLGRKSGLSRVGYGLNKIGDTLGGVAEGLTALGPNPMSGLEGAGYLASKAAPYVVNSAKYIPSAIGKAASTLIGGEARTATNEAISGAKVASSEALGQMQSYDTAAARAQKELEALGKRNGRPDLHAQGVTAIKDYNTQMKNADNLRKQGTAKLYSEASNEAKALEDQGLRINTDSAVKPLNDLLRQVEHIPELKSQVELQIRTLKGRPNPPSGLVDIYNKPLSAGKGEGLSYEQLTKTSRFLKDLAYKSATEGYDSIIPRATKEAAAELDKTLAQFAPKSAVANAEYARLSEPMDTLTTKLGSILHDTEGGLKGNRYPKTAPQNIPNKIFGTRSGFDQYVEALQGGANATPKAKADALAKAEKMQLDWAMETLTHPETGLLQPSKVGAPNVRAALGGSPTVRSSLERTMATQTAKTSELEEYTAGAKNKSSLTDAVTEANAAFDNGDKREALKKYQVVITKAFNGSTPQSQALIAQINRASELNSKVAKARKLALYIVGGSIGTGLVGRQTAHMLAPSP